MRRVPRRLGARPLSRVCRDDAPHVDGTGNGATSRRCARTTRSTHVTLSRVEVFRFVLPRLLAGCCGGIVAALGMILTNVGSLRDLVLHRDGGLLAAALLTFGCVVTFGSAAIGVAIMGLAWDSE